jgi:transposase
MLAMGTGLALHHPDFTAYKQRLRAAGKKPLVAAIAVAHRAHRLAFALIRSQKPYDAKQWEASVTNNHQAGRSVMAAVTATSTT